MTTSTRPVAVPVTRRFPLGPLMLLSLGVFVTVTAESLPAGLMPEMAADLRVDPLQIGLLVSVWALVVIVTSLPLARASASLDRRVVVAGALAVFALANLATALSPTYAFAFGTRIVAAVAHGVFWAIVMVYATSLLDAASLGAGLAIVTGGGTAANVFGLPLATALAQATSWRVAFTAMGVGMLALAAVILFRMPRSVVERRVAGVRTPLLRDRSLPALVVYGVVGVLIGLAQFASFTYVRPYLSEAALIPDGWASVMLFVFGIAGLLGVAAAGLLADRFPRSSLSVTLTLLAGAYASLALAPRSVPVVVAAFVVWGAATGAMFPLIQTALMRTASDALRALASAAIIVLFNIGIAGGSWIGGLLGEQAGPTAGPAMSAVAVLLAAGGAAIAAVLARRRSQSPA